MSAKLGRDTNSLTNYMMSGTKGAPKPEVGMGVTILMWSDRHAGTITWVSESGKSFRYRQDHAKRTDTNGMSEMQDYEFSPNPDAPERTARVTKSGNYKDKGTLIRVGSRSEYYDFSF